MFKVECPGCKAPYQVDERRIPSSGLKMRCPKCGTSFKVDPPTDTHRTGPSPVLGAALGGVADSVPPPVALPREQTNRTMLGVAPARPSALKGTMIGVAPAGITAPAAAPSPARPPVPPRPAPPRPGGAPAAPPVAANADLPAVATRAPASSFELPAGLAAKPNAPSAPAALDTDWDLPSVGRPTDIDLPSPRPPVASRASAPTIPASSGLELDLPSLGGAPHPEAPALPATASSRGSIDLPSVSRGQEPVRGASAARPPIPRATAPVATAPAARATGVSSTEPTPRSTARDFDLALPDLDGDLPELAGADFSLRPGAPAGHDLNLPSPRSGDLPALGGDLPALGGDLPALGGDLPASGGNLPALGGNLPSPSGSLPALGGNLPVRRSSATLPAMELSPPSRPSLPPALGPLPVPRQASGGLSEIELPPSESLPPPAFGGGFGEVDLLGGLSAARGRLPSSGDSLEADPFGEAPLPGPLSSRSESGRAAPAWSGEGVPLQRQQGGGGTDYGEVSLDAGGEGGGGADVALDAPLHGTRPAVAGRIDDDMEFGAVPQEAEVAPPAPVAVSLPATRKSAPPPKPKRRLGLRLLVATFVLGSAGAALALLPAIGPFGAYFVMDQIKAPEYRALLVATTKDAERELARDTYPDAARASDVVARARASARRAKGIAALAAYVGFMSELRFGPDAPTHARSSVLLDELADDQDVEMLDLARAARAAAVGQIAKARQLLAAAERRGRSPQTTLLAAEIELRAKDAKAAVAAWELARAGATNPRTQFGVARAKHAAGDAAGALAEAESVLQKHPSHVGARVLVARLSAGSREKETRALSLLEGVIADAKNASPEELVSAYTLLGDVHLGRSRITAAERAYGQALKINPKAGRALVGLGDSLYRSGRYSEAQARFEAGTAADPDDLVAKIGVAKTKLALERVQEASALLKKLREAQPKSPIVGYWYGRIQEALGARDQALAAYRDVIKVAPADPASADVYIAQAILLNQQGRAEEAQKTLDAAKQVMPDVPGVWRALGDVAQSQGRYKEALSHFQRASTLDPDDLGAKFRIGGALRRDGQFEEAGKAFDVVAAIDKDYPGLALERGLLFEASGRSDDALKQYEDALAKAPTDPDLMLRVGCGKVAAGRAQQAEELLKTVLGQRPSSAETHHCLGRALLVQGTRLADALRNLERAVDLDPNRAEYYLYVGWAANEAGNVPKAEKALAEALRLDQGLADAYWQRGVLRQRQGVVRDAIADLTKALALRPTRHEAHAALADAYYDLGREGEAMKEWQLAIQSQPDNATWRFRYGKLLAANRQNDNAVEQLSKALSLVESTDPPPRWRWEAHHALARALGSNPEAARHWEQFLRLGPRDSPYRPEAKAFLDKAGKPWSGD